MRPFIPLCALAILSVSTTAAADGAISKVSTHLYYHDSGVIDEREASGLKHWNTIIGEGDASGPSSAVVVRVTVSGAQTMTKGAVELVAQGGKKRLLKQRVSLDDYLVENGKPVVLPFLVYGTGCDDLAVTATLLAGKKTVEKKAVLVPFECGE